MKRGKFYIFSILLSFLIVHLVYPQNTSNWQMPYDVDEYTIGLWHFDETNGNTLFDSSPNSYHGANTNTTSVGSLDSFGYAREFKNDTIGFISFGNFNLPQYEGTIEYWVKPTIRPSTSCDHAHVFVKGVDGHSAGGFTFYHRIYDNTNIDFGTGSTGGNEWRGFNDIINFDYWQHIAFTWSTEAVKLYINGNLIGEMDAWPVGLGQTNHEVAFGRWGSLLYPDCRFIGFIDELRISNIERIPQVTASLPFVDDFTNGTRPEWNIIGNYWSFTNDKVYSNVDPAYQYEYMIVGDTSWTDYTFEVDLKGTAGTDKAIAFRVQDTENFYFLHLIGPIQYHHLELQKYVNGTPGVPLYLYQDPNYDVQNNVDYHIKVEAYGNSIKIYVNGNLEIDITDDTYSTGGIALLGGWNGYAPCYVEFDNVSVYEQIAQQFGSIAGIVSVNSSGFEGVTVELLDTTGIAIDSIESVITDASGYYEFLNLEAKDYQVGIVAPLGYSLDSLDENPALVTVFPNDTANVNFHLDEVVLTNNARGRPYWKRQFSLHIRGKGWKAKETETELLSYIEGVHQYYTPHFDIFDGLETFEEWRDVLRFRWCPSKKLERAKAQLAALVLNFTSLKIGQNVIVTEDNRTAGDVLTYCSILIKNPNATNDELRLAKRLARKVNRHRMIEAGIVPEGGILYKGLNQNIDWNFGMPTNYALFQNYPNPFNPSTKIVYHIPEDGLVSIKLYDILGNQVAVLVNEEKNIGEYEVGLIGTNLASGVYIYQMRINEFMDTKKMILMK